METITDFSLGYVDNAARWRLNPYAPQFGSIDPLAEKYPWMSPYIYCANNPIKFVDPDGRNPFVIGAGIAFGIEAALIATGIITTGYILCKRPNGNIQMTDDARILSSAIWDNIITGTFITDGGVGGFAKSVIRVSPGYAEQEKRERTAKDQQREQQKKMQEAIDNNIGAPSPDGTPEPKGRDISLTTKVVLGVGGGLALAEGIKNNLSTNTPIIQDVQTAFSKNISIREKSDVFSDKIENLLIFYPSSEKDDVKIPLRR